MPEETSGSRAAAPAINFNLLSLWQLLLDNSATPDRNAWAFGHAVVEYWTQQLTVEQLQARFNHYLQSAG
jgi:hypothetical protein